MTEEEKRIRAFNKLFTNNCIMLNTLFLAMKYPADDKEKDKLDPYFIFLLLYRYAEISNNILQYLYWS